MSVQPPPVPAAPRRDPDLVLARAHLRMGALGLARTELETLAGRGTLDDDAIRDLAEARWRTGDIVGAGEAAAAWLEGHGDDILGLVIAAEAQAALGRPAEARRLAGRALERADGSLDPIFAGMQRSSIWPVEAGTTVGPVGVLFDDLHPGPHAVDPIVETRPAWSRVDLPEDDDQPDRPPAPSEVDGPSLWGDDTTAKVAPEPVGPAVLVQRARRALDRGDPADAATGLILALRVSPGVAPTVLDLLAGRSEPILTLVRGDAARIVGHETDAMRDHAAAASALPDDRATPRPDADPALQAEGGQPSDPTTSHQEDP